MTFRWCSVERTDSSVSSCKGTNPSLGAPPSWPHLTLITSKCHHFGGWSFSKCMWGVGTWTFSPQRSENWYGFQAKAKPWVTLSLTLNSLLTCAGLVLQSPAQDSTTPSATAPAAGAVSPSHLHARHPQLASLLLLPLLLSCCPPGGGRIKLELLRTVDLALPAVTMHLPSSTPSHRQVAPLPFKAPTIRLHCRRLRLSPWVGKIPWRRAWQPTPVFFPGKLPEQRSLADYSPRGPKVSDVT